MSSGSIVPEGQRASDAPREPSLAGRTTLGKYQVVRELGAGGMGTVYLAVDSNLKRTVALKVLHKERASNETLVRRFESEATASAQLKHENIVTVYDAGQIDGQLFIALEFVDGTDIHELVAKRGAVPLKRSVNYVRQIARALDHLHSRGIVHRDIKPSNLLLTKDGVVKLTDLGLARAVDESLASNITREGTTVGTVDYMSPEQARNSQAADIRSDIYSLGCTWYQMLTGEPPYPEGSVTNKLYAHISKARPDPRAFNHSVPEEIVAVLHKMMARKADDRYQNPSELINDLDNLGSGYKRLEEVLGADAEENFPSAPDSAFAAPTRAAPLPLPPRQPRRMPRETEPEGHDRDDAERSVPERRMPARQLPSPARGASLPPRQPPSPARPGQPQGRQSHTPPRQMPVPGRQTPTPARQLPTPSNISAADRQFLRDDSGISKVGATNRRAPTRRGGGGVVSDEPVGTAGGAKLPLGELSSLGEWQPLAKKVGTVLAAVAAIGFLGWLTSPYWLPGGSNGTEIARNPFDPSAPTPQATPGADDDQPSKKSGKSEKGKGASDANKKSGGAGKADTSIILAEAKKPNGDKLGAGSIPGRPGERAEFPSWVNELWDPRGTNGAATLGLKSITVGRVGKEPPAQVANLSDAIARLPAEGGVIQLRGPGPFLLPSQRIQHRGHVIFAGAATQNGANSTGANSTAATNTHEDRPLIVIMPPSTGGTAAKGVSGLSASETSLTFYGVDLIAFADEFRSQGALRLVEVTSGDLIVQKCSLTLVGTRTAPTTAFTVSSTARGVAPQAVDRMPRVLLDRTVIRGSELASIETELPGVDFLAINSLFVSGQAPIFTLTEGAKANHAPDAPAGNGLPARTVRFFSCTTIGDDSAVSLRVNSDAADPPTTRFQVLNSVFGVVTPTQHPMVSLANWPAPAEVTANSPRFKNLSWKSQAFLARGWQENLVGSASGIHLEVRNSQDWGHFWSDIRARIDYQGTPFPAIGDFANVAPAQFKGEASLLHDTGDDTSPPGCETALVAVTSADMIARAGAFSHRISVAAEPAEGATAGASVREINLDVPNHVTKDDLAKSINRTDWPSGTRFLVHGTKRKLCSPIRVSNRSFTIEFLDKELVLAFDDRRVEASSDREAFITVTGGSIEIVNATIRIESSSRPSTHRLLDVHGGNFTIRGSNLSGPRHENPGYDELIRFSSSVDESISPTEGDQFVGLVRNSFLSSIRNLISGDLSSRHLVFENSLLVAENRIFDLRLPAGPGPSGLDLRSCTLSAGTEYFHFNTRTAAGTLNRAHVFVENSVFAPPVRPTKGGSTRATLFGSASGDLLRERVDWWEYGNAYSDLIELPGGGSSPGATNSAGADPLGGWRDLAGPAHIIRTVGQPGAVLLPGDMPTANEVSPADFRLKEESVAATWSDTGKPVGVDLEAQPVHHTKRASTPKPAAKPGSPKKSSAPQNQGGGL
jgi:eukaryotic-like serine/threonine-protein kinase